MLSLLSGRALASRSKAISVASSAGMSWSCTMLGPSDGALSGS